jgi:uncharacterized membrane protein
MGSRYRFYLGGFLLSVALLIGSGLVGLYEALTVLASGLYYQGTFVLFALVGETAEWLVAGLAFTMLAVTFLFATVVSVLRNVSMPSPKSSRVARGVRWLEQKFPFLERYDASKRVEPGTEAKAEKIKQRYVEGELSEAEFEREMNDLLDEDGVGQRADIDTQVQQASERSERTPSTDGQHGDGETGPESVDATDLVEDPERDSRASADLRDERREADTASE